MADTYDFKCPTCKARGGFEEVMVNVVVTSEVTLGMDGIVHYDDQTNEHGSIEQYQCSACGETLLDADGDVIDGHDELFEWFKRHTDG